MTPAYVKLANRLEQQVDEFLDLTREQQLAFMAMLPEWHCSIEDLLFAVKELLPPQDEATGE